MPEERRSSASRAAVGPDAEVEEASSLPDLPGVDTQSGLARVGGKVSVYRKILRQFINSQADAPVRIRSALASGDRRSAEREAHTLKGVAGNIGADEVQAAAKGLEAAIREDAGTESLIAELEGVLGDLLEALTPVTDDPDTTEVAPVAGEAPDIVPQLDRLQGLLEDYDGAAVELVSEIESQVAHTQFARSLREIAERIDEFEFDEALERLSDFRERVRS